MPVLLLVQVLPFVLGGSRGYTTEILIVSTLQWILLQSTVTHNKHRTNWRTVVEQASLILNLTFIGPCIVNVFF